MSGYVLNERDTFVRQAVEGLEAAHPGLVRVHDDPLFVTRRTPARGKVALVSGGGSGHEPLHTGLVGTGMLDAAVPGAVFTSPTALQVRDAARAVDTGEGVVLIVKNYTGDVLNFRIAADLLGDRHRVEVVVVDDDLATASADDGGPGRRGTAAVLAVEKICGAAAEAGAPADRVRDLGREVVARSATLGLALEACTNPMTGMRSFDLAPDEIEFGVGIHGERGIGTRAAGTAAELVESLVRPLVEHLGLRRGDAVSAIVNGLGATHAMELGVALREVRRVLAGDGIALARSLTGSYVTSLDMRGFSVTLTALTPDLTDLWDAPVRTPALTW
ncbi:PEP-dependent dihydroxyacetone kinase, dihydroxyacetone-binding subunit DhaK [Actinomadura sp. RB99]|uniref:dihydroxyacetone kinase subunit DhaK n=1 Tax=Actinomadura sp. RB99 TaxID=2691577 RepID=UPI001688FFF5|nr:dihydroxyacetone kinase subunit DhaK [Actinomadura sp. RB99]MBD2894659.1 PEP-dependent dihydroxyacetone kinase, dihydroxyacetone-binding subunit DhaK [Actinomadura sp. RB99]